MQPLDTAADLALKRIMRGDATPWDSDQRSAWTRYILSLMFRNPAVVRALKDHMREAWDVGVKALEANYADRRRPTDPATFEEYFALTNGAAAQIGAANMIAEIIDNQRVGPTIFNMHWSRIELSRSSVTLLNSDRPIDRPLGLADSRAYIAFPIGPRTLFLASNDPTLTSRISRGDHTKAAKLMNKTVVCQAREFVWGMDDSQLPFVQKQLRSALSSQLNNARRHSTLLEGYRRQKKGRRQAAGCHPADDGCKVDASISLVAASRRQNTRMQ